MPIIQRDANLLSMGGPGGFIRGARLPYGSRKRKSKRKEVLFLRVVRQSTTFRIAEERLSGNAEPAGRAGLGSKRSCWLAAEQNDQKERLRSVDNMEGAGWTNGLQGLIKKQQTLGKWSQKARSALERGRFQKVRPALRAPGHTKCLGRGSPYNGKAWQGVKKQRARERAAQT